MVIRTEQDQIFANMANSVKSAISPGATTYLTGTKAFTGPFFAITALTDSVIDVSECTLNINESDDSGAMRAITGTLTVVAGITIYGDFASVELDSGTAIGYSEDGTTVTVEA